MRDGAEDWDLWLRIMRKGYGFIPSRWITAVYRQKRHSMAKAGAESHVGEAQQLIARAYEPSDRSLSDTAGVHAFRSRSSGLPETARSSSQGDSIRSDVCGERRYRGRQSHPLRPRYGR